MFHGPKISCTGSRLSLSLLTMQINAGLRCVRFRHRPVIICTREPLKPYSSVSFIGKDIRKAMLARGLAQDACKTWGGYSKAVAERRMGDFTTQELANTA